MIFLYISLGVIAAIVVALLAVVLIRAALFTPKAGPLVDETEVTLDKEAVISRLAELIKCKTVSYRDPALEDEAEFRKLLDLLPTLYPKVFAACEYRELADRGLLFKWKGRAEGAPTVLMAHYDVVPVDEAGWDKPPFEAIIEDGVLWGRGSLDTKVTFGGVLSAAEQLISEGFTPENDIYFAFSGGEEVNGKGAVNIVDWFEEQGIEPAMVVDEGGAVVENVFPGVKEPCGLIGIAEKGMMNVQYTVRSSGGHASAPKPHTPVGILSRACTRLENKLREVLENTNIDESRILTEAAIFADKVAVDEETVRLRSHLEQMNNMLTAGGAVGRKLDFLLQEMNREANTIGSKCTDVRLARIVVDIKAELEKIREQTQNIE